jgi:hypothetical protein
MLNNFKEGNDIIYPMMSGNRMRNKLERRQDLQQSTLTECLTRIKNCFQVHSIQEFIEILLQPDGVCYYNHHYFKDGETKVQREPIFCLELGKITECWEVIWKGRFDYLHLRWKQVIRNQVESEIPMVEILSNLATWKAEMRRITVQG